MSRKRLQPIALGAIMVLVPSCFYLGTLVNEHFQQQQQHAYLVGTASLPPLQAPATSAVGARSEPSEAAAPAPTSRRLSTVDELALLEGRLKSLKSTRYHLENDLKSNEEKLRRLAERMARADAQATEET